jgi:hypothetical protein
MTENEFMGPSAEDKHERKGGNYAKYAGIM